MEVRILSRMISFTIINDGYIPNDPNTRISKEMSTVVIRANKEISLILLTEIVDYLERISEYKEFDWCFELDSTLSDHQVNAYLYPMVV